jgi:predicted nucleic acid-binding protein
VILLDAGAMVALLDRSDRAHRRCAARIAEVREALATTWPVVGEALARLEGVEGGSAALWELLSRSQCRFVGVEAADRDRLRALTTGRNRLTLAQASLVAIAEREGIDALFTLTPRLAAWRRGRKRLFRRCP